MTIRTGILVLLLGASFSGCLTEVSPFYEFAPEDHYRNPGVFNGSYQTGSDGSLVLDRGDLVPGLPSEVRFTSSLDAYEGLVPTQEAEADIVMAIWRPVAAPGPVPVIVDAGPYFEIGGEVITNATQKTEFLVQNYLPHGYAVVQLAVRGTGTAGGCMDLMGPSEMHDLDQAITWLGEQEWSSGAIGMIGASYDGSTPWIVAAAGNPYLKTIVPVSGLPSMHDLMFRNGSAETRGPIMHNTVYWGFGFDDEFPQQPDGWPAGVPWLPPAGIGQATDREPYQDYQNLLCPEVAEGSAVAAYSTADGGTAGEASTYWTERDYRQRVLDNYEGSVFLVHGLQDWNVDPHVAIPFNQELRQAGIEMKEWYGQWGHAFPDSTCIADAAAWAVLPCRLDFAEVLLRWFEYHLKGVEDVDLGPEIQVQDNVGFWRNADSYPPLDAQWTGLRLSADGLLAAPDQDAQAGEVMLVPDPDGPGARASLVSAPFPDGLHISGLPRLELPFEVAGQGGHIAAWLFDLDPRGYARAVGAFPSPSTQDPNVTVWRPGGYPIVGHAQMNLRHYDGSGGSEPLVPGQEYVARIQFEPLEVRIPEGHRLMLWIFQFQYQDRMATLTPSPVTVHLGDDAVLHLPTLDVDPRTVFPVPGAHFLNRTYVPEMYVPVEDPSWGGLPAAPVAERAPPTTAAGAAPARPRALPTSGLSGAAP